MFAKNLGKVDRALRIIVGAGLILGFFLNPDGAYSWLYWLGIIPLAFGVMGTCPPYALLGINTCKVKG